MSINVRDLKNIRDLARLLYKDGKRHINVGGGKKEDKVEKPKEKKK